MTNEEIPSIKEHKLKTLAKKIKYTLVITSFSIVILIAALILFKNINFTKKHPTMFVQHGQDIQTYHNPNSYDNTEITVADNPQDLFPLNNNNEHSTDLLASAPEENTFNTGRPLAAPENSNQDLLLFNLKKLYSSLLQGTETWRIYGAFLENFYKDHNLHTMLNNLRNTKIQKIPNNYDIISEFEYVYKEIDLNCLKANSTLWHDIKYLLNQLLYVRNVIPNLQVNTSYCSENIDEIQDALQNYQLEKAYQFFLKYKMYWNAEAIIWAKKLEAKIITDNLVQYLDNILNNNNFNNTK